MVQTVTLNGAKLKAIGHANHTAEVTMTSLAMRERLRHFSDIVRTRNQLIREGEKIVENDYRQFWKDLQDAGVGVIVTGKRGKPDRFLWHYSMKKVAKAALEGSDEKVEKIHFSKSNKGSKSNRKLSPIDKAERVKEAKTAPASGNERFVYIPLRKNYNLELSVPSDLSRDEIEVISGALRRLSA